MTFRRAATLALALGLLLAACSDDPAVGDGSPAARNATQAPLLPTTVAALPSMDVDGFHELLGQLKGTPVVVNVWGSWCPPCIAEASLLHDAAARYGDRIQFVGVDILDDRGDAAGFIAEHGLLYPSVFDPDGAIRDDLGSVGQPVTVFIDADGNEVDRVDGQLSAESLQEGLDRLLG